MHYYCGSKENICWAEASFNCAPDMSVTLVRKVRLRVGAAAAKPGPAIGQVYYSAFYFNLAVFILILRVFQALGPLGINMAEFCKQFNDKTKAIDKDTPIPVILSAFSNRTFTFITKSPPTTWFLKKCAGLEKCAGK